MKVNCMFENLTPLIPLSVARRGGNRARRPAVGRPAVGRGGGEVIRQVSFLMFGSI